MLAWFIVSSLIAAISAVGNVVLGRHTIAQNKQILSLTNSINSEKQTSLKLLEANTIAETDAINAVSGMVDEAMIFKYIQKHPERITEEIIYRYLNSGLISQELVDKVFRQITMDDFGHTWKVHKSIEQINRTGTNIINYYYPEYYLPHTKIHKICSVCGIEHFSYKVLDDRLSLKSSEYIQKKSKYWILDEWLDDNVMCPGKPFVVDNEQQTDKPNPVAKKIKKKR